MSKNTSITNRTRSNDKFNRRNEELAIMAAKREEMPPEELKSILERYTLDRGHKDKLTRKEAMRLASYSSARSFDAQVEAYKSTGQLAIPRAPGKQPLLSPEDEVALTKSLDDYTIALAMKNGFQPKGISLEDFQALARPHLINTRRRRPNVPFDIDMSRAEDLASLWSWRKMFRKYLPVDAPL